MQAYEEMALEYEERITTRLVGLPLHDSVFWKCHSSSCGFDLPYGCAVAFIWRVEHCRCGHFGARAALWTYACSTSSQRTHLRSVCLLLDVDVDLFV